MLKKIIIATIAISGCLAVSSFALNNDVNAYTYIDENGNYVYVQEKEELPVIENGNSIEIVIPDNPEVNEENKYQGVQTPTEEDLLAQYEYEAIIIEAQLADGLKFDRAKYIESRQNGLSESEARRKSISPDYGDLVDDFEEEIKNPDSAFNDIIDEVKSDSFLDFLKGMAERIGDLFTSLFS